MKQSRYQRNITLNYGFSSLINLGFTRGLWMIYLAGRGFSLAQLGALEAIFHVTSFLMEVPTGSVADIWGRKASRLSGRLLCAASLLLMFFSQSFLMQVVGFILSALGYNLESGAGDALVYDSLLIENKQEHYMKVMGKQELVGQGSAIVAFLVGGYLATKNYGLAYGLSVATALLGFLLSLGFKEPTFENVKDSHGIGLFASILHSLGTQMSGSVSIIRKTPKIAFFILFSESMFAFMVCLFFYLQNYWTGQGSNEWQIGWVFSLHALVGALFSAKASAIERKLGQKRLLFALPALVLVCLWGVVLTPFSKLFYVLTGVVEGVLVVAISDYLNRLIPSSHRATILSFQSMAYSCFMIIIFPVVGIVGTNFSLSSAFLGMAIFASSLIFPYWLVLYRQR